MGKFGEPWLAYHTYDDDGQHVSHIFSDNGDGKVVCSDMLDYEADRIRDCVNALDGIADPVAWRKAVEEREEIINELIRHVLVEPKSLNRIAHTEKMCVKLVDSRDAIEKARVG